MAAPWRMVARRHGGPEVIERESFDPGMPGVGELLVETEAVGLNFIDTYYRSGLYPADPPVALGAESVGTVVAIGAGVRDFAPGDRVACVNGAGAYATHRIVPAARAVPIPEGVGSAEAAAAMLKGLTAWYLAERTVDLEPGQRALVHSAAGGVGSLLVPWLRDNGVIVIAHVGSAAKAAAVAADHVLSGTFADLAGAVREITEGAGVDVVFDGVGRDSWSASLACLRRRGMMVSYGNASGAVPPVSLLDLMRGGSLYATRPTLADYVTTSDDLREGAFSLFERMRLGIVAPRIGQRYALSDAAEAHRALEARETVGSTVLVP